MSLISYFYYKGFEKREIGELERVGDMMMEIEVREIWRCCMVVYEDRGKGYELRDEGGFWILEKVWEEIFF